MNRSDQALIAQVLADALGKADTAWETFRKEVTYPNREPRDDLMSLARVVFRQAYVRALDAIAEAAEIPDDMDVLMEVPNARLRRLN